MSIHTEEIKSMIDSISDNKLGDARNSFETVIKSKIADELEAKKVSLASSVYSDEISGNTE